jgi:hypothetical protein
MKEEQLYTKGFNDGYLMSKHEPELLAKLLKSPNDNSEYFQALKDGSKQHEKEKDLEEIKRMRDKSKGKDKGQEHEY